MICLLINYYWALYLGEKIHLHWNKCQGMAREFILFVHICHRFGGKTAVPFKTSSGWPTACHRSKMKTPEEWGAGVEQGRLYKSILSFLLFSQNTNFSPLWIPHFKKEPQIQTHTFYRFWTCLRSLLHILDKSAFQHRRGTRNGKTNFGNHTATRLSIIMGPGKEGESMTVHCLHQRLAEQVGGHSPGETPGHRCRKPDSNVTSFTTFVTFCKTVNTSGPHLSHR